MAQIVSRNNVTAVKYLKQTLFFRCEAISKLAKVSAVCTLVRFMFGFVYLTKIIRTGVAAAFNRVSPIGWKISYLI